MSRPPHARARGLQAFAELVLSSGVRAATLEAVAERAGISKGGLLYHFASKDALVDGLIGRLRELAVEDTVAMKADPSGVTDQILRTSTVADSEFETFYLAVVRLAQGGYPRARDVLTEINDLWTEAVTTELGDPAIARLVVLLSDGIYSHAALQPKGESSGHDVDELLGLVRALLELRRS